MSSLADLDFRVTAIEQRLANAVTLPKDVLDITDTSVADKTNRWVAGQGIAGINSGGMFIGYSTVANPTLDAHLQSGNKIYV